MRGSPWLDRRRVLGLSLAVWGAASLAGVSADDELNVLVNDAFDFTGTQLTHLAEEVLVDGDVFTDYTDTDGKWLTREKKVWTSGMTAGVFWYQYACTGDEVFKGYAEKWTEGLEGVETADDNDVGFQVFNSYGLGYKLVADESYKDMVLTGADTLYDIRYMELIPAFYSWTNPSRRPEWDIAVNVDMMMNMEILLWAAANGGNEEYTSAVIKHADTTWKDIVRSDNSTFHVAAYDPDTGVLEDTGTYQGAGDDTTWSRGQAWAVHGFVMVYRYTEQPRFLDYSLGLLRYFLDNLPDDYVPQADFDAEVDEKNGKDSSSTAIVASALFEMFWTLETPYYLEMAQRLLKALFEPGYYEPDATDGYESILRRASQDWGTNETGAIFGDYYFLETLERYKRVAPSIILRNEEPVDVPGANTMTSNTASGGRRMLQTLTGGTRCALKFEDGVLEFEDGCEPEAPEFPSEEISSLPPTPVPLAIMTPSPAVDSDGLPSSPPTIGEAELSPSPTEGSPSPTESTSPPAEGTPSPAEGTPSPAEGTPSPTESTSPPAEGTPSPAEGNSSPAEGTPSPAEGTSSIAEGTSLTTEGTPSPTEGTPTPTEGTPSPAEGTLPPAEGTVPPAEGSPSPTVPSIATPSPVAATLAPPTVVTPSPSGSAGASSLVFTFGSSRLDNDVDLSGLNEDKEVLIWFGVTLEVGHVYPSALAFELNESGMAEVEVEAPADGWKAGQNTVRLVAEPGSFVTPSSSGTTVLSVTISFAWSDSSSSGASDRVTVDWLILGHDLAL